MSSRLIAPAGRSLTSLLLVLGTSCSYDTFHSPVGSGYRIGLALVPTLALVLSLVGLLTYLGWRRTRTKGKR